MLQILYGGFSLFLSCVIFIIVSILIKKKLILEELTIENPIEMLFLFMLSFMIGFVWPLLLIVVVLSYISYKCCVWYNRQLEKIINVIDIFYPQNKE